MKIISKTTPEFNLLLKGQTVRTSNPWTVFRRHYRNACLLWNTEVHRAHNWFPFWTTWIKSTYTLFM